jgi:hypothetical protein
MPEILQKELETYKQVLPTLADRAGQFALLKDDQLIDVFVAYEDALKEGYKRFGTTPFLVKQIEVTQSIHYFSRDLNPCPV